MFNKISAYVFSLALLAPAMAQAVTVFPVDTASATTLTNVSTDIVAWGVVLIAVALTIYAFKRIRGLITR